MKPLTLEQLKQFATLFAALNDRIYDVGEAINRSHYTDYENTLDNLAGALARGDETFNFAMEDSYQGGKDTYTVELPIEVLTCEDYKPLVAKALEERQRKMAEERKKEALRYAESLVRAAEKRLNTAKTTAEQDLERAKLHLAKVKRDQATG